ncbi:MAG: PKD domain-containing protein [Myxococcota bacterium]
MRSAILGVFCGLSLFACGQASDVDKKDSGSSSAQDSSVEPGDLGLPDAVGAPDATVTAPDADPIFPDADAPAPDAGEPPVNHPPVASAGPDLSVQIGDMVALDGSGSSDVDGTPLTFTWTLISSPRPGLQFSATGAHPSFVPTWNGRFEIELIVSDGVLESRDTLVLMVDCRTPLEVRGYEASAPEWFDQNPPPSCLDVIVRADTLVPGGATLTLDPGVRVAVDGAARFGTAGGNFIAVGTESAPIWIGGTTAGPGGWRGLELADAPNAQIAYVTLEGGGGALGEDPPNADLEARGGTTVLIEHSILRGSAGFGARIGLYVLIENIYGDTFTGNAAGPLEVEINQVNKLGPDSTYTGNGVDKLRVRGSSLNTPSTWSYLGVPFVIGEIGQDTVSFGRDVRIEAGVTVEVLDGVGIEIPLPFTTFESFGEAGQRVHLIGQSSGSGMWRGLLVRDGAHADLRNTTIEGGGGGSPWTAGQGMSNRANLSVLAGQPPTEVTVLDSDLLGSMGQGIWIEPAAGVSVSCTGVSAAQPIVPRCPYQR